MADKRAFFKVDVGYLMNPKIAAVAAESPTAVLLHLAAIGYSAQHLTDGVAPLALVQRIAGATDRDAELCFKRSLLIDRHDGDVEVHDYLEHQRSAAEAKDAERKARKAAAARWDAPADARSDASSNASSNASGMPTAMPREREEREKEVRSAPADAAAPRKRGTRIPDDFAPDADMRAWAAEKTPDVDPKAATEEFVDYWRGVAGAKGVKLDWPGTWRNHMRKRQQWAEERAPKTGAKGRGGHPGDQLPW